MVPFCMVVVAVLYSFVFSCFVFVEGRGGGGGGASWEVLGEREWGWVGG